MATIEDSQQETPQVDTPLVRIIDDDPAVRSSLEQLVRAMKFDVACYASALEYLEQPKNEVKGCIVLDVRMPGMSGIELQQRLRKQGCRIPIIIITGHANVPMTVQAMKQGAVDFLEKPYRPQELREAIRSALELDKKLRAQYERKSQIEAWLASLSPEERDVLDSIVDGKPNKIIASELDISLRTVQFRRKSIMEKFGVESRAELIKLVTLSKNEPE